MNPLRLFLLLFFIPAIVFSTAVQVVYHVHGNDAVGGSESWVPFAKWTLSILFVVVPFGLWVMMLNGRRAFREHFPKMAALCLCFGLPMEVANLWFLRCAIQKTAMAVDQSAESNAAHVAWLETEEGLKAEIEAAQALPAGLAAHISRMDAGREEIARLVQQANDMDNDGNGANDKLIPGLLAAIESRKADLANLEATHKELRAEHAAAIVALQDRLANHRLNRPSVMASAAAAQEKVHPFVLLGRDFVAMAGVGEERSAQAEGWALTLAAALILLLNYGCTVGLKGAFLLTELAQARQAKGDNIITGDFAGSDRQNWILDAVGVTGIDELRSVLRKYRAEGIIPLNISSVQIGRMSAEELRALVKRYVVPSFKRQRTPSAAAA